jgi:Tfp pilus assembly protein PilF
MKIGRNEPCSCGSGKKFKKCCLGQTQETKRWVYTDLDQLSNSVVALIDQGRLDEAEKVCQELKRTYPDQIDGIHRMAEVYEARGDKKKAAEYYRKAAEFAKTAAGFDEQSVKNFMNDAHRLESEPQTL